MNPILKRRLKILGYMSFCGLLWGALAGGAVGFIVGLFAFLVGAIFGLPYGAFLGAQVGLGVGFICGLVTLWFEARSVATPGQHRNVMIIASVTATPLLIYLRIIGFYPPTVNTQWWFLLPVMTVAASFAFFVSRRLVKTYAERFVEWGTFLS